MCERQNIRVNQTHATAHQKEKKTFSVKYHRLCVIFSRQVKSMCDVTIPQSVTEKFHSPENASHLIEIKQANAMWIITKKKGSITGP